MIISKQLYIILNFITILDAGISYSADIPKQGDVGPKAICSIQAVARCLCPASMVVSCELSTGTIFGAIPNDTKASSVNLGVTFDDETKDTLTLEKPMKDTRSYYSDLKKDDEVIQALKVKNLTKTVKSIWVISYDIELANLNLFLGEEMQTQIVKQGQALVTKDQPFFCDKYVGSVEKVTGIGCEAPVNKTKSSCVFLNGTRISAQTIDLVCGGDTLPVDPQVCALDKNVTLENNQVTCQ